MKTVTKTVITCQADGIRLGYYDQQQDKWVELEPGDAMKEASEKLDCSEALLEALAESIGALKERIAEDLHTIWERLDSMER